MGGRETGVVSRTIFLSTGVGPGGEIVGGGVGSVGLCMGIRATTLEVEGSAVGAGTTGEASFVVNTTGDLFPTIGDTGLPIAVETIGDTSLGTTGESDLVDTAGDGGFCFKDPAPAPEIDLGGVPTLVFPANDPGSLTLDVVEEEAGRGPKTVLGARGALAGYI